MTRCFYVPPLAAFGVLMASLSLAVWTLHGAISIEPTPPGAPIESRGIAVPLPRTAIQSARLGAAVKNDPFRAERRPPAQRFRLPGESLAGANTSAPESSGAFQLIGTAVMTEGRGFAMCQRGVEPPRLVRIGERIGELTLERVAQGRAVFADGAGRRTELRVPKAGS